MNGVNIRASSTFRPGNIAAIQQSVVLRAVNAVTKGTELVKSEAQTLCPVDTGELRASIASEVALRGSLVTGTVYATAPHAAFVEFGTGLIGRGTYPFALPQSGVPYTGSWVYDFRGRGWKGMPAKPYMRPALDGAGPQIIGFFREEGFQV
jgi:HK97 gp10 family phage protein